MIATGLHKLDEFLSGGIPDSVITDIFGSNATGKTQFLFQLAINAAKNSYKVLYVDTSGTFRPERLVEIQQRNPVPDMLDKITVLRVTNTLEQARTIQVLERSNFDAVLVDNITDLFSYEYQNTMQIFERNALFMQYLHDLSLCAIKMKIPIVITNMVRQVNDMETENMHVAVDPFTHIKIHLFRDTARFSGRATWLQNSLDFSYEILDRGITDPQII